MTLPKIVSLFSGAGGLDLGFRRSGFKLAFAVDSSTAAVQTHRQNFPGTASVAADLRELGPEGVVSALGNLLRPGEAIGVIGGPPCQGFSRANTSKRLLDPRNDLPLLYLSTVEMLQELYDVKFVLFENVLGIRDSKHQPTFATILSRFRALDLYERVDALNALDFGVPQRRSRIIVSAFQTKEAKNNFAPTTVQDTDLTVRAAIGKLPSPAYFTRNLSKKDIPFHPNHWTMQPRSKRFSDPALIVNGTRSFRRLDWDEPSPTVAYGNREIHVHPGGQRRLSIYEAMRLQGFPPDFVLHGSLSAQVEQVSNAVPPPLAEALAQAIRRVLQTAPKRECS